MNNICTGHCSCRGDRDELFYDNEDGGYFASPAGNPYVIIRLKEYQEGAEPAAAAVSVSNLYRLAHLFYDETEEYEEKARATVGSASSLLERAPFVMGTLASNAMLDEDIKGIKQIIVTGAATDSRTQQFLRVIRHTFIPNRMLIHLSSKHPQALLGSQNELIQSMVKEGKADIPEIRICEGRVCGLPIVDPKAPETMFWE
ncbi:MAG: hypothetical protein CYPHOPRED_003528 [Cyphobasidiales sp. Tagirdzhanova-0007]|nr:MAG: hypothetical protein CYPHOPRED_003528 [Cyphobasidiales sp. Tagirdzhanova-0007]